MYRIRKYAECDGFGYVVTVDKDGERIGVGFSRYGSRGALDEAIAAARLWINQVNAGKRQLRWLAENSATCHGTAARLLADIRERPGKRELDAGANYVQIWAGELARPMSTTDDY